MPMYEQICEVLDQVRNGLPARLTVTAEGTEYLRNFLPRERLILLGGGHVAQPVCRYGADLGFAVTVVDDRPSFANATRFPEAEEILCTSFSEAIQSLKISEGDYVCVITRGHRYDAECVRAILRGTFPRYLGMIGSRRRVRAQFQMLEEEGFPRSDIERSHSPIGLDIGALSVNEIGISIVAELIACRRKSTMRRSHSSILADESPALPVLEFLADRSSPRVLILVLETAGSTPAKAGAIMGMDKAMRTVGTIGGGCGESEVLTRAFRLLNTGTQTCVTVDMTNDVAEDEGMVCGGTMKVLIADLS